MIMLFPHRDEKTKLWGISLKDKYNINTIDLRWHPFFHFFEIILCSLKYRSRPVYFFRYLGDYPDIFRTLIRLCADILTIAVCLIFGGQVRWIVHNVDRETFMHHPRILGVRRRMIGRVAQRIYVTDECLLPIARDFLGFSEQKLSVVTFGCPVTQGANDFTNSIVERVGDAKSRLTPAPLFGLCATALVSKCEHLFRMEEVLQALNADRLSVIMILVCDVDSAPDFETRMVVEKLAGRPDVIAYLKGGFVSESALKGRVDFVYRSLSDQSIPYTLYNAAQAEIPVLTHDVGLTGTLVRLTGIGVVWDDLLEKNCCELKNMLTCVSSQSYRDFLVRRSWERGADALAEGIAIDTVVRSAVENEQLINICNNYLSSKVHSCIAKELGAAFYKQVFIIPVRTKKEISVLRKSRSDNTLVPIFFRNSFVRFFPLIKSLYVFGLCFTALRKYCSTRSTTIVLAHNFWSDGTVAFLLSLFKPIRYTLVVRNTDINIFIPRLPHYRWLMKWMILRSNCLVFVSDAHRKFFIDSYPRLASAARKLVVIPNGIDDFWLDSIAEVSYRSPRICYVGRFNPNKNLSRLVEAFEHLGSRCFELELVMVGGSESELESLIGRAVPPGVSVLGFIDDKETLREVYRSSRVFAMPSITETFGLVYLEAISQGCAVLCTENQGIDGMFNKPYVRSVNPLRVEEIEEALLDLLLNEYGVGPKEINQCLAGFSWNRVGRAYAEELF